ncbi:Uncharacterised protein [Vibrio cholerae]|nr:Uncharacterised protein [Vibrio cholerae]
MLCAIKPRCCKSSKSCCEFILPPKSLGKQSNQL